MGGENETVDRRRWLGQRSTVRYNRGMTDEPLRTLRFLLSRLERISADSSVAYRASGVRGAMLRLVEKIEDGRPVSSQDVKRLVESAYLLLQKAAREKIS